MNWRIAALALPLLAFACGKVTSLGDEKGGGNAGQGASAGDGGGAAGAGGVAGAAASGATAGAGGSGASTCDIAPPPPLDNPTPQQLERAKLIHEFCVSVIQQCPDWTFFAGHAKGKCSPAELVLGCEEDILESYLLTHVGCDAEWKSWIICGTNATYDAPNECANADAESCMKEKLALSECGKTNGVWTSVTGAYTTCQYGPSMQGTCAVMCDVGDNRFDLDCGASPGLPLLCNCTVNGNFINQDFDGMGPVGNFYATDCADAGKRAADGQCTNRLECCFQYTDGAKDVCLCGSDPKLLGQPTCQALADFAGGKVVDICPQYEWSWGGNCWPPPCQ